MVFVNEGFAAQRPNGYSEFTVELDPFLRYDGPNTIRVETRAREDSRWYSGAGIYRDVRLIVSELTHIEPRGVTVTTPDVDTERAVVEVAVRVRNARLTTQTRVVDATVQSPTGVSCASATSPVTVRPVGHRAAAALRRRPGALERQSPTFDGRALAIIRPTGAGEIRVTVSADGLPPASVTLRVESAA